MKHSKFFASTALTMVAGLIGTAATATTVLTTADGTINNSLCVGNDCTASESFGFDTIRMKENNNQIHFDDTSSTGAFPSNDWRIKANDSTNGGDSYLAIEDATSAKTPFRVDAGAPTNSVRVKSNGNVGFGNSNPVVDLHVTTGNTPTLRLEQDTSSGFAAQTWDVAGNETNFFVRDITNGSLLPFRIEPSAPNSSLYIDSTGNVGINKTNPTEALHVYGTDGGTQLLVQEESDTTAPRELLKVSNNGQVAIVLEDTSVAAGDNTGREWKFQNVGGEFRFTTAPGGANEKEMVIDVDGNLTVTGTITSGSTTLNVPDYVFAPDYVLRPLNEVRSFIMANSHLPDVPSAAKIGKKGVNMTEMQMTLLRKVEELTLYTLKQEDQIQELRASLDKIKG